MWDGKLQREGQGLCLHNRESQARGAVPLRLFAVGGPGLGGQGYCHTMPWGSLGRSKGNLFYDN